MTPLVAEILRQYDERIPGARDARTHDTYAHIARSLTVQQLAAADWILANEGIDQAVRYRVLAAMALGGPTAWDAEQRYRDQEAYLRAAQARIPEIRVSPERYEQLLDQVPGGRAVGFIEPEAEPAGDGDD